MPLPVEVGNAAFRAHPEHHGAGSPATECHDAVTWTGLSMPPINVRRKWKDFRHASQAIDSATEARNL